MTSVAEAVHIPGDFPLAGNMAHQFWQVARPVWIERDTRDGARRAELATEVRVLWSERHLYVGYRCPFSALTTFEPPQLDRGRIGLWERDVVEIFLGTDAGAVCRYTEFEIAPTNEKLDVAVDLPNKNFEWRSRFESAVQIDADNRVWRCEVRIPFSVLTMSKPSIGIRWRANFFRVEHAADAFLAWSPTFQKTFHVPERFGILAFVGPSETSSGGTRGVSAR